MVTVTSRSDSDFDVSLKENKRDGVDPNSNDPGYCVRKNEEKILWFSADCMKGDLFLSRYLLPAIALYLTQQNWKCLHIRIRQDRVSHLKLLKSLVPWEKTSTFLVPCDLTFIKRFRSRKPKDQALLIQSFETLSE